MSDLSNRRCEPCRADTPRVSGERLRDLSEQVSEWQVLDEHHLRREFRFRNFWEALAFVNRVGELAEDQGHHPEIRLGWGYATFEVFTHAIDGLSENDFILAAGIDAL